MGSVGRQLAWMSSCTGGIRHWWPRARGLQELLLWLVSPTEPGGSDGAASSDLALAGARLNVPM